MTIHRRPFTDAQIMADCPWATAGECAMVREREVAGTSAPIPDCPVHGAARIEP